MASTNHTTRATTMMISNHNSKAGGLGTFFMKQSISLLHIILGAGLPSGTIIRRACNPKHLFIERNNEQWGQKYISRG